MTRNVGWLGLLVVGISCAAPTSPPPPPPPPPAPGIISIAANVGNTNIQQGATFALTVLVGRAGGFTGAVTLTVEGLPSGVAANVSNETTAGTTTTFTVDFTASMAAATGLTNLVLRARGTGVVDAVASFGLTVTAAPIPSYELIVTGAPLSVPQGGNGQVTVTIARSGGFAGSVDLTVQGAPTGLTASINPSATTGTTATLTVIASAGLAAGTYVISIRGTAAGVVDRIITMSVSVTAVTGTGDVVFDFSNCGSPYAIWGAYRDGNGSWTQVIPSAGVFRFSITQPLAAFVHVIRQGGSTATTINVRFMTRAEMSAAPIEYCPPGPVNVKIVNGSTVGLTGAQAVSLNLGGAFGSPSALFPTFTIAGVPDGDRDLVAYRFAAQPALTDRVLIRRDLNVVSGATLPPLDFASTESMAPVSGTLTVGGLGAGDALSHEMYYLARSSCDRGLLYPAPVAPATTMFGVDPAQQRADDYHQIKVIAAAGAAGSRTLTQSFHTMGNRAVTLGGPIGAPTITSLGGNYKRLQAEFGLPVEYTAPVMLRYLQTTGIPRIVELIATRAWLGTTAAVLAMPNLSSVSGWLDSWGPGAALAARWSIVATGGDVGRSSCGEGVQVIEAFASGTN